MREVGLCGKPGRRYAFKDNGADILLVAHLDTVLDSSLFGVMPYGKDTLVFSPELDDRLGVYLALDYLPALGVVCDILLTDHEEIGATTAEDFIPGKTYHAIIELDRGGVDAVLYQYDGGALEAAAGAYFDIGCGSYSDISAMEHCGCECINLGIGYQEAHTEMCHVSLNTLQDQAALIAEFIQDIAGEQFPYVPRPRWAGFERAQSWFDPQESSIAFWRDQADSVEDVCPECGRDVREVHTTERGIACVWCGELLEEESWFDSDTVV